MRFIIKNVVRDVDVRLAFDTNDHRYVSYNTMVKLVGKENIKEGNEFEITATLYETYCCSSIKALKEDKNSEVISNLLDLLETPSIKFCPFCGVKK